MITGLLGGVAYSAGNWPPAKNLPTLVFLHGSGGSQVLWQAQVDAMDGVANTVVLDLPGHGKSRGKGSDCVAEYAAKVMSFIRAAKLPRPVPCGLSLGGAIALQLLLDQGREFFAGVLVGTGARLRVNPGVFTAIEDDYAGFVASMADFAAAPQTDPARLQPLLAAMARTSPTVTAGDFRACNRFDVMVRLGEIDRPVLVVSGEEDKLTPPKYADYLEAHLDGARRAHLDCAGHLAPLERPLHFNTAIRSFLSSLQ